jgi:flagellar motor switch protein FliG
LENILGAADPISHGTLLANLARHDRRLVQQLTTSRERQFTFGELQELDDADWSRILMHAAHETIVSALAGAGRAIVARAIRILPVARAARLRRDLDRMGELSFRDIELAQQELAELAGELNRQGQLGAATGRKLSIAI